MGWLRCVLFYLSASSVFTLTVPCATFRPLCYLELPKTWFRTVNGIGAVTDGVLTVDDLIEMFLEEEE